MTSTTLTRQAQRERRVTAWLLFFGLFACYFTLHPGSIGGMGYTGEEIVAGVRMLGVFDAWSHGRPMMKMAWSRHGPLPVLFNLPFISAGRALVNVEFGLSIQPILLTAGILTVLYLWLRQVASAAVSVLLTMIAAFGTMFWPYAYIGLETKQTFAVLLVGYLGLAGGPIRSWPRVAAFALVCALAVSLKSTGPVLAPAVLYVLYVQFGRDWRANAPRLAFALAVIAVVFLGAAWGRNMFWGPRGGGFSNMRQLFVGSTADVFTNVIGLLGSPTKGLFVYAPVLIAILYAIPIALRRQRDATVFALLVAGGTAAFLCMLRFSSDEVWGPRYLHVTMAPLLVTIGAAWPAFDWRRHLPIAALGAVGVPVALLGAFFYYGNMVSASAAAGQNTMEWITEDHMWNPITMNARLFEVWYEGGTAPAMWTPAHMWAYTPPGGVDTTGHAIDLRPLSEPQSFLVRYWRTPVSGAAFVIFWLAKSALLIGPALLIWAAIRTRRP